MKLVGVVYDHFRNRLLKPTLDCSFLFLLGKANLIIDQIIFSLCKSLKSYELDIFHIFDLFVHNIGYGDIALIWNWAITRGSIDGISYQRELRLVMTNHTTNDQSIVNSNFEFEVVLVFLLILLLVFNHRSWEVDNSKYRIYLSEAGISLKFLGKASSHSLIPVQAIKVFPTVSIFWTPF